VKVKSRAPRHRPAPQGQMKKRRISLEISTLSPCLLALFLTFLIFLAGHSSPSISAPWERQKLVAGHEPSGYHTITLPIQLCLLCLLEVASVRS
jgi:hypothetical protein